MLHYCYTVTVATRQVASDSAAISQAAGETPLTTQQQGESRQTCVGLHAILYAMCVVLCRTRRAQVIACSSLLHHDQRAWAADAAPNSEELVWANLG